MPSIQKARWLSLVALIFVGPVVASALAGDSGFQAGDQVTYKTGTTTRTGKLLVKTPTVDLIARDGTTTTQDHVPPSAVVSAVATPSPTATVTSTPTATPPPSTSFPDASNTGVPTGTTLAPSGGLTINTAGTVVDGKDISGPVVVNAANVTIRNSRIRATDFWVVDNNSTGLLLEDVELDGRGANNDCIGSANLTIRRANIHSCENGFNVDGSMTVEDSYVHDLTTANGAHTDGAQFGQGASDITFRHNTIRTQPAGTSAQSTSAIIMWDEGNPQNTRVHIENNILDGSAAAFALYPPKQAASAIYINNNRIRPSTVWGYNGYTAYDVVLGYNVTEFSGNVDDITGKPVTASDT